MLKDLSSKRVLMVGAGGIGCELIKNLVLSGFLNIEIVDLDTVSRLFSNDQIDLSNLNRQFLFNHSHIKKSKAVIAAKSAKTFNSRAKIIPHFASIFDAGKFPLSWFGQFDIILNALDNLPARRHVNMMAFAAGVPLVESGTAGYLGQVTVHYKNVMCFDCEPKPTPKTYPVCTIRSTPSAPVHCIVWSKTWLLGMLFGAGDGDEGMTESDAKADDLENLKTETNEMRQLREFAGKPEYAEKVFKKIFGSDVGRLAAMTDLWKDRQAPIPLAYTSEIPTEPSAMDREQSVWSYEYTVHTFTKTLHALQDTYAAQSTNDPQFSLIFDKDDDISLDFVTACTNLRSRVFGIPEQSRWTVKEIAGNIIPAIATTNAIIAGLIVLNAVKILSGGKENCKNVYLVCATRNRAQLLNSEKLVEPAPSCGICSTKYTRVKCDLDTTKISDIIDKVIRGHFKLTGDISIEEGGRLLYDDDFVDNTERTLASLNVVDRIRVNADCSVEDREAYSIVIFFESLGGIEELIVVGDAHLEDRPVKRKADDDEEEERSVKRMKSGSDEDVILVEEGDVIMID